MLEGEHINLEKENRKTSNVIPNHPRVHFCIIRSPCSALTLSSQTRITREIIYETSTQVLQ